SRARSLHEAMRWRVEKCRGHHCSGSASYHRVARRVVGCPTTSRAARIAAFSADRLRETIRLDMGARRTSGVFVASCAAYVLMAACSSDETLPPGGASGTTTGGGTTTSANGGAGNSASTTSASGAAGGVGGVGVGGVGGVGVGGIGVGGIGGGRVGGGGDVGARGRGEPR